MNEAPTTIDRAAVEALYEEVVGDGTKGVPDELVGCTLGELARSGRNVLREGAMPALVLKERALAGNLAAMAEYCRRHGVLLAPHGKTTMAPQLMRRQVETGAWAITAATPAHLRVYRRFGIGRILYANPLVESGTIRWLAGELERDPDFELLCLVDSVAAVELLDDGLRETGRVGVLVELGYPGGRCGARDRETALRVAAAVDAAPTLTLRGVECFESLLSRDDTPDGLARIDAFLEAARGVAEVLRAGSSLAAAEEMLVSAGGSSFFDRDVRAFVADWDDATVRVVLRSGCYITHDSGFYELVSPLAGRAVGEPALEDAIEIWSSVLSRPEPELAILGMGRRDAPTDMGLPVPRQVLRRGAEVPTAIGSATVRSLNDQHAHVVVGADAELAPGDLVACAVSHPCTAIDKWRLLLVVDDEYRIVDAISTFF
jgi:D-serine deaminase-like pyridoxal phosphate-dependent protein